MARTVGIGVQDFGKLITDNLFYIDKTKFIKEWWESGDSVTLITRPRRFGKTLNLNMLDYFFSNKHSERSDLFETFSIWQEEKYRQIQGTYPVISLSFANIKENTYEATKKKIYDVLVDLYIKNSYLRDSEVLTKLEREFFDKVSMDMEEHEATMALHKLSDYLYRYYGKKVILLLDEYDTPMQEAYVHGFWNELVAFTRSMFNATFKTNPYLERGLMTGITRVSRESIFSDLNHLEVVTTTSDKYADSFGFTEEEVFAALDECGLGDQKECVKTWYDGFIFGELRDIYNPWSVLNFLAKRKLDIYWANSSGNRLVGKLIQEGGKGIKTTFEKLLKDEVICCPIDEQIVYDQLGQRESAIWSLLVASGYLKVISRESILEADDAEYPMYELALTNREVKRMFFIMVNNWFGRTEESYGEFMDALLAGDLESMNVYMNDVTMEIFSYFDSGSKTMRSASEKFYHGFVLGLIVQLRGKYYITSNRESGLGRYDVMLEPKSANDDAMIIEFKVFNERKEKTLEETVEAALLQIEEKQYEASLIARGISKERIRKYGFAFEGKNVLIGEK